MTLRADPRPVNRLALAFLVLANLPPLIGVFFWGWSLSELLIVYWIENAVIGLYTILRIVVARPEGVDPTSLVAGKLFGIPFFTLHYGIFWLVHGIFVVTLFGGSEIGGGVSSIAGSPHAFFLAPILVSLAKMDVLAWPVIGLVLSHGVSFVSNYLGGGEYRKLAVTDLMGQPYGRVVILHLTLLFGAFIVMLLRAPQLVLVLFVALKVGVDVQSHLKEHEKANRARTAVVGAS